MCSSRAILFALPLYTLEHGLCRLVAECSTGIGKFVLAPFFVWAKALDMSRLAKCIFRYGAILRGGG